MSSRWKVRLSSYAVGFVAYAVFSLIIGPLYGWAALLFAALVVIGEQVVWYIRVVEEVGKQMRRGGAALALLTVLTMCAPDAIAGDHYFRYEPLQPMQPIQPIIPQYRLPSVPSYQMRSLRAPSGPSYTPPPQNNYRDLLQRSLQTFEVSPQQQQEWQRTDKALQRNYWQMCAKYNPHCVNMLRSLGD